MESNLLAQLQLLGVRSLASIHQLEETVELVGRALEHLERLVRFHRAGQHLALR